MPSTPEHCLLMNEAINTYSADIFKQLDYMYYITRTFDLLDINWKKLVNNQLNKDFEFNYFNENPDEVIFHRSICFSFDDLFIVRYNRLQMQLKTEKVK